MEYIFSYGNYGSITSIFTFTGDDDKRKLGIIDADGLPSTLKNINRTINKLSMKLNGEYVQFTLFQIQEKLRNTQSLRKVD